MSTQNKARNSADVLIAQRIKDRMKQQRFTLRALSQGTGIPYRTFQSYMLAAHTIPAPALGRIAEALDVSADWLILERPPNIDKEVVALSIRLFSGQVQPVLEKFSLSAGAEIFVKIYERNYFLEHLPHERRTEALEKWKETDS